MATATHAVVYAQLLINGAEYGVHVFFLQLRDENMEPLPGIEVGDIGTKVGENEADVVRLQLLLCAFNCCCLPSTAAFKNSL